MDIGRKADYPASALSNFAGHRFIINNIQCNSMEGFLQSLKFANPEMQKHICTLVGYGAKKAGKSKNWKIKGTLYWKGATLDRFGMEYQLLIDSAYNALFSQSKAFRKALKDTRTSNLTHSIGKRKMADTVLTSSEFCSRLMNLRNMLLV